MDKLFQKYTDAFDALDPIAISNLYKLPCTTSDRDGVNIFTDRESLINKFDENCLEMTAMGYKSSKYNILNKISMGDTAKAINVAWRVQLEKSELEFRCLYICHKIEGKWLIFSANVYEGLFNSEI